MWNVAEPDTDGGEGLNPRQWAFIRKNGGTEQAEFPAIIREVFRKSGYDIERAAQMAGVCTATFRRWAQKYSVSLAVPRSLAPKLKVSLVALRARLLVEFADRGQTLQEILTHLLNEQNGSVKNLRDSLGVPSGSSTEFRRFLLNTGLQLQECVSRSVTMPVEQRRWEALFISVHGFYGNSVPNILRAVIDISEGNLTKASHVLSDSRIQMTRTLLQKYCEKYGVRI